jgi:hypothetical protein
MFTGVISLAKSLIEPLSLYFSDRIFDTYKTEKYNIKLRFSAALSGGFCRLVGYFSNKYHRINIIMG